MSDYFEKLTLVALSKTRLSYVTACGLPFVKTTPGKEEVFQPWSNQKHSDLLKNATNITTSIEGSLMVAKTKDCEVSIGLAIGSNLKADEREAVLRCAALRAETLHAQSLSGRVEKAFAAFLKVFPFPIEITLFVLGMGLMIYFS